MALPSSVEVGEKKDRYDDALNAMRAAVEEGILPGGDVALLKASLALTSSAPGAANSSSTPTTPTNPDVKLIQTADFDQDLGVSIICRALTQPMYTNLSNAGEESNIIVGTLAAQYGTPDKFAWGYDTSKGEYVNMIKAGIVLMWRSQSRSSTMRSRPLRRKRPVTSPWRRTLRTSMRGSRRKASE